MSTLSRDGMSWADDMIAKSSALCQSMGAPSFEQDAINEIATALICLHLRARK
jgi:hypothetical protein